MKVKNLPTIKRLPVYLQILKKLKKAGEGFVSTTTLINELRMEPMIVRKDLVYAGITGTPGKGYNLKELIKTIEDYLGWGKNYYKEAFLIGTGDLGSALLGYNQFEENGFKIIAGFDTDPEKIGTKAHGKQIFDMKKFGELSKRMGIKVAVLTVPAKYAQDCTDILIEAGIEGIWNFTGCNLKTPDNVIVQNEDLSTGLAVFTVKMKKHREMP